MLFRLHGVLLFGIGLLSGCAVFTSNTWRAYATVAPSVCSSKPHLVSTQSDIELEWAPPTSNADGSRLTDLAAYRIDWGEADSEFDQCVWIGDPAQTSYRFGELARGEYQFAVVAINESGVASKPSGIVRTSIP